MADDMVSYFNTYITGGGENDNLQVETSVSNIFMSQMEESGSKRNDDQVGLASYFILNLS